MELRNPQKKKRKKGGFELCAACVSTRNVHSSVFACLGCDFTSDTAWVPKNKIRRTSNGPRRHGGAGGHDARRMNPDDKEVSADIEASAGT